MGHAHQVEGLGHHEVDEVVRRARQVVEARHRRQHDRAGAGDRRHVLDVDQAERRLARHQHQPPALLQHHVGAPVDEVAGRAVGDRRERRAGARRDQRGRRQRRPGGEGRRQVVEPEHGHRAGLGAEALDERGDHQARIVGRAPAGLEDLVADDVGAGVAHAQPHVAPGGRQGPQSPPGVHGAARSRDPEEDPHHPSDGSGVPAPRTRPAERGGRPAGRCKPYLYVVPRPESRVPICLYCSGVKPVKFGITLPGGSLRNPS